MLTVLLIYSTSLAAGIGCSPRNREKTNAGERMIEKPTIDKKKRFFHAWKCEKKIDCLPWGKKPQPACGKWSVKASKHDLGEHPHLKGNCPFCGRTIRLNTHGKVHTYETREAAEQLCDILNKEEHQ